MIDYAAISAEVFLSAAICGILLVDVFLRPDQRHITYMLSLLAIVGAAAATAFCGVDGTVITLGGSFISDPASGVLKMTAYLIVAIVFLYSRNYLIVAGLFKGEYFILGLFGLLGIMVMISAYSLLTMYLGLELLSLSLYALVAFNRDDSVAAESAMKYFVLGAIASGTLLYGMSLLYGVSGTLELAALPDAITRGGPLGVMALLGIAFMVAGIAFKFGAVPFHMWLPDVYQGSPTAVTLYVGTAPKIGAFALAWRLLVEGLGPADANWQAMLIVLAVLSLAIGNIVAIAQTNIKRMLGYSTISHVGFILLGFVGASDSGIEAAMFYTLTYALMAAGAFGMILLLSHKGFEAEYLDDFKGLHARSPWFAFVMLMILLSLAGIPPLVGFDAKLAVISSVVEAGLSWLAIYAVVFAVVGAFYYLRVIWYMYFTEPQDVIAIEAPADMRVVLSLNGAVLVIIGIFPGFLFNLCERVLG